MSSLNTHFTDLEVSQRGRHEITDADARPDPELRAAAKRRRVPGRPERPDSILTYALEDTASDWGGLAQTLRAKLTGTGTLVVFTHQNLDDPIDTISWSACTYVVRTDVASVAIADASRRHDRMCQQARARRRSLGALAKLTGRERQVLGLIAEGVTSKAIAERLGISPRTVGAHRSSLMKKLRIHSVAGLVRLAVREGVAQ